MRFFVTKDGYSARERILFLAFVTRGYRTDGKRLSKSALHRWARELHERFDTGMERREVAAGVIPLRSYIGSGKVSK